MHGALFEASRCARWADSTDVLGTSCKRSVLAININGCLKTANISTPRLRSPTTDDIV
eukprot:COSAG05_NODE_1540_length_4597_cov_383.329257_3_plen_58_part_00